MTKHIGTISTECHSPWKQISIRGAGWWQSLNPSPITNTIPRSNYFTTHHNHTPGQTPRVPGGWRFHISRHSAHEGGKVVSPTPRPPLHPEKYTRYSYLLAAGSSPGFCQWKIRITPTGIKLATLRLAARCLNKLRHRVPPLLPCSHP